MFTNSLRCLAIEDIISVATMILDFLLNSKAQVSHKLEEMSACRLDFYTTKHV